VPCPRQLSDVLRNAARAARRNRVAPLITEFGANDDLASLRRQVRAFDAAGMGWQYWQYKTYFDPTTDASSQPGGADAESIVSERGRVKQAKLRVLARAYPERIDGSDASWSFDDRRSVFRFSYRPSRDGGESVVRLPMPVHYRRGYVVSSRGATTDFVPGGSLTVSPEDGARRVSVRVAPRR
jgi:endoglycosylceramidase